MRILVLILYNYLLSESSEDEKDVKNIQKRTLNGKVKRKSYSLKEKIRIIKEYEETNLTLCEFAKTVGITKSSISEWNTKKDILIMQSKSSKRKLNNKRLLGGGRKIIYPEIEKAVYQWIIDERKKNCQVTYPRIIKMARSYIDNKQFKVKFSTGWLRKFQKEKI